MKLFIFQVLKVKDLTFENISAFTCVFDAICAAKKHYTDLSDNCLCGVFEATDHWTVRSIKDNAILGRIVKVNI